MRSDYLIGNKKHFHRLCVSTEVTTSSDPEDVTMIGGVYVFPKYVVKQGLNTKSFKQIGLKDFGDPFITPVVETSTLVNVVKSASTSDTLKGSGAQIIYIEGLDKFYNIVSEEVQMNGTTEVDLQYEYFRINEMWVTQTGNTVNAVKFLSNAGNIIAYNKTGGDSVVYAQITALHNQMYSSVYTPTEDLYITNIHVNHDTEDIVSKLSLYSGDNNMLRGRWNISTEKPAGAAHDSRSFSFNSPIHIHKHEDMKISISNVDGTQSRIDIILEGYFL